MIAALLLLLTLAAALCAAAAAAWQAPPSMLAGALALAFGSLALASAATASALRQPDDLTEPRHRHGPTAPTPWPPETVPVTRRAFGPLWLAAAGALGAIGLVPLVALARKPGRSERTGWGAGVRVVDENGAPVGEDYLARGGIATVFPQGAPDLPEGIAVLVRDDGGTYRAFSKVCTHAGCPVALYRRASRELICPCHQSIFDVENGGKNVSGPAPRPLPMLPLGLDDAGHFVARGDFNAPVGPDDWDRVL